MKAMWIKIIALAGLIFSILEIFDNIAKFRKKEEEYPWCLPAMVIAGVKKREHPFAYMIIFGFNISLALVVILCSLYIILFR